MAARNPQTAAKRARELALREKRERKREKKAEAAARRAAAANAPEGGVEQVGQADDGDALAEPQPETDAGAAG